MRNNKCPARAALGANFEVSTRSPASSMHGMDTGTEVEDSDATVAPDAEEPMSDGESINSEATGEKSPSFLNTQAQVFGRSSGERSEEFNQPISPELPLASGTCIKSQVPETTVVSSNGNSGRSGGNSGNIIGRSGGDSGHTDRGAGNISRRGGSGVNSGHSGDLQCVDNSEPETTVDMELDDVMRQQKMLLCSLEQVYSTGINVEELKKLRDKATELESSLKEISTANQAERKRLATAAHTSLSQPQHSQSQGCGVVEGSEHLRRQLLSLAGRQKTLLQCFNTQKELVEKLDKVPVQTPLQCEAESGKSKESSCMRSKKVSLGHSAAIPNLLQHLNHQIPGQVETMKSKLPQPSTQQQQLHVHPSMCTSSHAKHITANVAQQHPLPSTTNTAAQKSMCLPAQYPAIQTQALPTPWAHSVEKLPAVPQHSVTGTQSVINTRPCVPTSQPLLHTQLVAVPVPLQTLIQHHYLQPGEDCISCILMGCEFKCSLSEDGSLCTVAGARHRTPNQWVQHCWSQLGQHKHCIRTKFAFKNVLYRGIPLMSICEQFNRKQVFTYHQMKIGEMDTRAQPRPMNAVKSCVPGKQLACWSNVSWNMNSLLIDGHVFPVEEASIAPLQLPADFWGVTNDSVLLTPQLVKQFESDLDW